MNVIGVKTQSVRDAGGGTAWMTFTVGGWRTSAAGFGHVAWGWWGRIGGVRSGARRR